MKHVSESPHAPLNIHPVKNFLHRGDTSTPGKKQLEVRAINPSSDQTVNRTNEPQNMTNKVNMTTVNQDMTTNSNRHGSKPAENSIKKALKLFSTNGAGIIYGKVDSLKHEVKATCATDVTVQETHCKRKGRIQSWWYLKLFGLRKVAAQCVQLMNL